MAMATGGPPSQGDEAQLTGQEVAEGITGEARERAQAEFSQLAPGPSDPLHFGPDGVTTQLDEDPISEVNPFQESLP